MVHQRAAKELATRMRAPASDDDTNSHWPGAAVVRYNNDRIGGDRKTGLQATKLFVARNVQ